MTDDDILLALKVVIDPELGVNIVDLGLVHRVAQTADGIEVALTMTSPSCPLGEMLVEQAEQALHDRFKEAVSIRVELLRDFPWSVDRMTAEGQRQLGLTADGNASR
jgi:metal-sulfur cluster biosynthetic enzyme